MGIRWRTFEVPKRIEVDRSTLTSTYGRFVAEPFERGFGATIGNSLRRVLISSIEGAAVTSVKMEGVQHEFSSIPGVLEDVPQIIMNIKRLVFRSHSGQPKTVRIQVERLGDVTGADIQTDDTVEVLSKDAHIATLTKKVKFSVELTVSKGRGFVPAERNRVEDKPIGVIPTDSVFTPVRRVNFSVEDTRVGQMTDYDRLILEVWTDSSITPEEAVLAASHILKRHLDIFLTLGELPPEEEEKEESQEEKALRDLLNKPISELELSVRSANCLRAANIKTLHDLVQKTEAQMLKYRNFGKKSLTEIQKILEGMSLSLGMKMDQAQEAVTQQAEINT
ncbi:MAG: DNA-directed RNA polymerase subunit alpha [Candidatus Omnitrophica bacterium]|nr:DNA-directed RNA polymerase subunit alpha [Candidatus Omnitrophota bacterium]